MSGICGIFNLDGAPVDPAILQKMAEVCAYRGPDGIQYWIQQQVGLAHLALHTTRESLRERQPLSSEGDGVFLTADARVDNRDELIRILTVKGFLTSKEPTDADLIMASYVCWGENCPIYILGDFAFAIWDARQRKLFCARDAVGARPLHYSKAGYVLCVASEAQQVLQHPGVPCRLDEIAMADHLSWSWRDQDRSMFQDVSMLAPGYRLTSDASGMRIERYWEVDRTVRTVYRREEEYAEHFLEIFSRAVGDRLRVQGETIGLFLSGGLDSCSIAPVAQRLLKAEMGGPQLIGYSHTFSQLSGCSERSYSDATAASCGMEEVQYIDSEHCGLLGDPLGFGASLEVPVTGYEPVMQETLLRAKDRGARVLFTGFAGPYSCLGDSSLVYAHRLSRGDLGVFRELFSFAKELGLPGYRVLYSCLLRHLIPGGLDALLRRFVGRPTRRPAIEWIAPEFAKRTGLWQRWKRELRSDRRINLPSGPDSPVELVAPGLGHTVHQWDRFIASFGMECRHPYLDRRLFEFLLSIPPEQVFRGRWNRLVIRRALKGLLPDEVRWRRDKSNFEPFIHQILRKKAVPLIRPLLGHCCVG